MKGRELAAWRAKVRTAIAAADGDVHPKMRTSHAHWHYHGPDSGVPGLDSEFGHSHMHSHGKQPDLNAPWEPDNDHDHSHDDVSFEKVGEDETDLSRPDRLPGVSGTALREIRAALTRLRDGMEAGRHPPMTYRHGHLHNDGQGGEHYHTHSHHDDNDHADHDHADINRAMESAERAKQQRRQGGHAVYPYANRTILNSAARADQDRRVTAAFAKAAADIEGFYGRRR